jgi:hypothetical protein
VLHITNGDAVLEGFRNGGVPGTYLAWRDPLHDGPVPSSRSLEALSDVRARVLSGFDWGEYAEMRSGFAERDRTLGNFRSHDETVLWFEHDLYDQLQLLQILDWLSRQDLDLDGARISLVQIGEHPEVPSFHGLGELSGAQLARLLPARLPVTQGQLAIGREGWEAFCAPDPTAFLHLARRSFPEMPFLSAAMQRCLEEYPSVRDGLSRTEQQLLAAGASGARHRQEYFAVSSRAEACPWGDLSVYLRLDALSAGPSPALDRIGAHGFALNDQGRRLLAGEDDWLRARDGVDLWIGGVHLQGGDARWRWDATRRTLVGEAATS